MKNKTRLFGIYLPFFILILAAAITLRAIATTGYFNFRFAYFTNPVLPAIADVLIICAILFFIIYIIAAHRKTALIPSFSSPANYIPSAAVSASLIFMILHLIRVFIKSDSSITKWLSLIISVFAALSIIYFALNTIFIRHISARRANFGLFFIIFLSLYLAYLYFDDSTPINSPIKVTDQMAYLFSAVFFLYEIRLSLGREKWNLYIIFGFITAILTAYSSIPTLITYFITGKTISNSIYESVLTFSIFLYATLKLLLTDKLIDKEPSAFVCELSAAAKARELEMNPIAQEEDTAEMTESTEENEVPDENQISILEMENRMDNEDEIITSFSESETDTSESSVITSEDIFE